MRRLRRTALGLAITLSTSLTMAMAAEQTAHAQSTSEQLLAQSLFDDGRQLMDRGRFSEACPKLAESQRLDPGGGTLLNLALCHEKEGKVASAYLEMKTASSQAAKDGRKDREKIANEHLAALASRVPKLAVHVAREDEGLEVRVDGTSLRKPAWDLMTVVDPGAHVIDATAPGKAPFRKTITLAEAEQRTIQVPALDVALSNTSTTSTTSAAVDLGPQAPKGETRTNPLFVASVVGAITGYVVGASAGYVWLMLKVTQSSCSSLAASGDQSVFCASSGVRDAWFATAAVGLTMAAVGTLGVALLPHRLDVAVTPPPARDGAVGVLRASF